DSRARFRSVDALSSHPADAAWLQEPSLYHGRPRSKAVRGGCDMSYVIGVDGGTESLRAFVFDLDGRPRASHATAYKTEFPHPSWAEQDPEDWWQALGQSVKGALAKANVAAGDVIALCVDTTCCSVVALDRDGHPLRPAMIWMDVRSARQDRKSTRLNSSH